jgi:Ni/Fe-hydrogenase subunit HybB-like protein
MSTHVMAHAHAPVGGHVMTRGFRILLAIAAIGGLAALYRFVFGLGAVSYLNDGYPWGIWISFDVVTGTALGCGATRWRCSPTSSTRMPPADPAGGLTAARAWQSWR